MFNNPKINTTSSLSSSLFLLCAFMVCVAVMLVDANFANAQGPAERSKIDMSDPNISPKEKYLAALDACRLAIKHSRRETMLFYDGDLEESSDRGKLWKHAVLTLRKKSLLLREQATAYFLATDTPGTDLIQLMLYASRDLVEGDDPKMALDVLAKLRTLRPDDLVLQRDEALLALRLNDFGPAVEYMKLEVTELNKDLTPNERGLLANSADIKELFDRELELRAKDAEADDLPRVEIKTIHGPVVVELFENEAPETVANFVYLVELGFYDGMYFHPVVKDLIAQAGGVAKTGLQDCGYRIKDEMRKDDARKHFRGSLCMANKSTPDSGDNEFYVSTFPSPLLDWDGTEKDTTAHTVFGRVISGMDAIDKLTVTFKFNEEDGKQEQIEGAVPDEIVTATVLRKRDHEYKPNRITDEK